MSDLQPFELVSFEREGRELLQRAAAKAKEILRAAGKMKERIETSARLKGFEEGQKQGAERALEREQKKVAKDTEGLQDLLRETLRSIDEGRARLIAEGERDLVRLAVAIAEKIVKAEVVARPDAAAANVRRAVELLANRRELEVQLHPKDLKAVETYLPELREEFPETSVIRLVANETISRGGCKVAVQEGAVDADIETQLAEIERALLG